MLVLQVFIMRNGAFEGTEMVTGDRIEIGRDPTCGLVLDDESCSRRHAVLFEHEGKIGLQDLGSANGTRINGEPIGNGRYVGARDDVAIGVFTLKVKNMAGQGRPAAPPPAPVADGATRVMAGPSPQQLAQMMAPQPSSPPTGRSQSPVVPSAGSVSIGAANNEPTAIAAPSVRPAGGARDAPIDVAATAALAGISASGEGTVTQSSPPPVPMSEPSSPSRVPAMMPDVTAPDAEMPAAAVKRQPQPQAQPQPRAAPSPAPMAAIAKPKAPEPMVDFELPDAPVNTDGDPVGPMAFAPTFLDEELHEEDEEPVWSLVQRLVRPNAEKSKEPLLEVIHYRGELVVDHQVLKAGDTFKLGDNMTRAERRDRGIPKVLPLVRLKAGGVAEVFQREEVQGKLLRGQQQLDLIPGKGATPITDGELASLKVGNERVFVRFANAPKLVWTKEDAADDRFARRVNGIAAGSSVGLFMLFAVVSWVYQYRNADSEVIKIDDEGFADVEIKELKMEEPPKEPEKPPEPIETKDPVETKPDKTQPTAKPDKATPEETKPAKPGVMDILNNIPKVDQSASNQNLTAALSNIKGVRVPGGAAGVKVSSLIGKAPTSGVQIGGAAGGLSTNGINSLIRKDGAAGALGGKGDRAVSGKVTIMARQIVKQGQGELSKEEIQKVINQHIGEIQYCYEKQLNKQPGLAGRVVLEWGVNPQGHVSVVKVAQSSMNSADATNCMMGKLKSWKFPPPRGGAVTIVFPFVFNTV